MSESRANLSESSSDSESELEGSFDSSSDESESEESKAYDAKAKRTTAQISANLQGIELARVPPAASQAQNSMPVPPGAVVADGSNPAVQQLNANNAQVGQDLSKASVDQKNLNLQRFLALWSIFSGSGTIAISIYALMKAENTKEPTGVPVTPDTTQAVAQLVKLWTNLSDKEYWEDLANYADPKAPHAMSLTLGDQVLFMNYTIDLSPTLPFIWQSSDDLTIKVNELYALYANNANTTPMLYRHICDMRYKDAALPRPVAATLLRYALTKILVNTAGSPSNPVLKDR